MCATCSSSWLRARVSCGRRCACSRRASGGAGGDEAGADDMTARGQILRGALALPALLASFLLGQAILDRRGLRLDLTPGRRYTLSDQAEKILDGLPADVRLLCFLRSQDPRNAAILDLLRRVEARSPRVHVDVVDVNRSPALAREYGVDSYGALVAESGGRRRVFSNPQGEVLMAGLPRVTAEQGRGAGGGARAGGG